MNGTVKKIITHRGFGFISHPDSDEDIFFHNSQLQNIEIDRLREGASVEFDIEDTMKGPQAINIRVQE
jgi:CspA family cold shock protein